VEHHSGVNTPRVSRLAVAVLNVRPSHLVAMDVRLALIQGTLQDGGTAKLAENQAHTGRSRSVWEVLESMGAGLTTPAVRLAKAPRR
jgi:hypothetical protein